MASKVTTSTARNSKKRRSSKTSSNVPPVETEKSTKQDAVIAMLRRPTGATIAEISAVTNWQAHSVRGFFSGALKKRLKIEVISEKNDAGERRYFVAPLKEMK